MTEFVTIGESKISGAKFVVKN